CELGPRGWGQVALLAPPLRVGEARNEDGESHGRGQPAPADFTHFGHSSTLGSDRSTTGDEQTAWSVHRIVADRRPLARSYLDSRTLLSRTGWTEAGVNEKLAMAASPSRAPGGPSWVKRAEPVALRGRPRDTVFVLAVAPAGMVRVAEPAPV